ncbi:hypothetical protein [Streptomyces sp. NPDC047869]|uniref:hypothetical protein n=1 Tax=Streptomyces sp. NPDC047869 TaxID=3154709 RepID=UPI0034540294
MIEKCGRDLPRFLGEASPDPRHQYQPQGLPIGQRSEIQHSRMAREKVLELLLGLEHCRFQGLEIVSQDEYRLIGHLLLHPCVLATASARINRGRASGHSQCGMACRQCEADEQAGGESPRRPCCPLTELLKRVSQV